MGVKKKKTAWRPCAKDDLVLEESRGFYRETVAAYKAAAYEKSYELNEFWAKGNMEEMLGIINGAQSALDAVHSAQKTWLFSVNTADGIKAKAVDWLLANQKKSGVDIMGMGHHMQESEYSNPSNNVIRNGRRLTPDFLRTVSIASEIFKRSGIRRSKRMRVVELGGGCGHLARTLRLFAPDTLHVIIDIPETLFFSYIFLKLNFPDARTLCVTGKTAAKLKDGNGGLSGYDFVFVPTMFADCVAGCDFTLFVNTASLGEMKNKVIRHWMDFLQSRLRVKYLYTLNRFLNTVAASGQHDWRLDENECSVLYGSKWKMLDWEMEPSFTRCPYLDTVIARYVQIIAERGEPGAEKDKVKSRRLLREVMDEDWVRLAPTISPMLTRRDNTLASDLTMDGALFKLWESIRLDTNHDNVSLMLKYLETLLHRPDREFEETFYYEALLERLCADNASIDTCGLLEKIREKRLFRRTFASTPPTLALTERKEPPYLAEEDYKGFNIVLYGGRFYALAQSLGPLDVAHMDKERFGQYEEAGKCAAGWSLYDAKCRVEQLISKDLKNEADQYDATLKKTLEDMERSAAELRKEVAQRDRQVTTLNKTLEDMERSAVDLRKEVAQRDGQIATLKKTLEDVERSAAELRKEAAQRDGQIAALSKASEEANGLMAALREAYAEKTAAIEALKNELNGQAGICLKLKDELFVKNVALNALREESFEKGLLMEGLTGRLKGMKPS